jgi:NitT/TauT family transport system ATP-binding protein
MTQEIILTIGNLNKQYNGNGSSAAGATPLSIFSGFNLTCYKHQITSIVGPSGCGKSSLLNIIAGLDHDYTGSIVRNIQSMIGYIFQDDALIPWKNVAENILLGVELQNGNHYDASFCNDLMRQYDLYEYKNYFPQMLSGGMRQKVALAQMMINMPDLVLLDEPFSSQDFFTKIQLENLFYRNIKDNNLSAILVTHDIDEAIALSDRIIVLSQKPCRILKDITFEFRQSELDVLPEHVREMTTSATYFADIYQTLKPEL